jgi:hypothetical protein
MATTHQAQGEHLMNVRTCASMTVMVVTVLTALAVVGCNHSNQNSTDRPPEQGGDMIVTTNWAPTSAHCGAVISVGDVTSNTSGLFGVTLSTTYMYINTTLSIAGLTEVGTHTVPALATHGSYSWSGNVTVPAGLTAGNYFFITVCDKPHNAQESNYNNNTNYCAIAISCP